MECMRCGAGTKLVQLVDPGPGGCQICAKVKSKSIWDSEKMCVVDCYVCPRCGHIELSASKPELFQDI